MTIKVYEKFGDNRIKYRHVNSKNVR